jgi:hypothetical protein
MSPADSLRSGGLSTNLKAAEVVLVEVAFVETDRAYVEAPALVDELGVHALDRGVLVGADALAVAVQGQADALGRQPHHDLLALVECGAGREVGHEDPVWVLFAGGAADDHASVGCHLLLLACQQRDALDAVLGTRVARPLRDELVGVGPDLGDPQPGRLDPFAVGVLLGSAADARGP